MTTKEAAEKQLEVVKSLKSALTSAVGVLHGICPHETYTTVEDPTAHACDLCGVYLATDSRDGTGTVPVPHRIWKEG